jgi:peptide/nickel transport system substrate-binding protein
VERVVFKYIPQMTVLKTQFVAGAIDAVGISGITPDNFDEVRRTRGLTLHRPPTPYITLFAFNNGLPQFKDRAVRQALHLAMDKETINRDLFYDANRSTESFLPQENWAHNPNLPKHVYDPAQAAKLLDDAGWRRGPGGVRVKDGVRLAFSTSTVAGNHLREQVQQFLQQSWQPLGVEVSIRNHPAAVMWGDVWRNSEWQTTIVGEIFPIASDPDASDRLGSWAVPAKGGAGQNSWQYANAEVDALLQESTGLLDQEKRKQNYWKIQEIVRDDLPFLPLHQQVQAEGTKAKLVGYEANLNYRSNAWNLSKWHWLP